MLSSQYKIACIYKEISQLSTSSTMLLMMTGDTCSDVKYTSVTKSFLLWPNLTKRFLLAWMCRMFHQLSWVGECCNSLVYWLYLCAWEHRQSPAEFVVPLAKYHKAVYNTHVTVGMRFRMVFETEESSIRRYTCCLLSYLFHCKSVSFSTIMSHVGLMPQIHGDDHRDSRSWSC